MCVLLSGDVYRTLVWPFPPYSTKLYAIYKADVYDDALYIDNTGHNFSDDNGSSPPIVSISQIIHLVFSSPTLYNSAFYKISYAD